MSLLSRLKRLWELSATECVPLNVNDVYSGKSPVTLSDDIPVEYSRKRQATVVQDDIADLFPPEINEDEPHDKTS